MALHVFQIENFKPEPSQLALIHKDILATLTITLCRRGEAANLKQISQQIQQRFPSKPLEYYKGRIRTHLRTHSTFRVLTHDGQSLIVRIK